MGKIFSLLFGTIAVIVGLILFAVWWGALLNILKGIVPMVLILGGLIAVVSGFSEFKDSFKSQN